MCKWYFMFFWFCALVDFLLATALITDYDIELLILSVTELILLCFRKLIEISLFGSVIA